MKLFKSSLCLAALILLSCSSSQQNDKYPLVTNADRRAIDSVCVCIRPVTEFITRHMNEINAQVDSGTAKILADSLDLLVNSYKPCGKQFDAIEDRARKDKEYEQQLVNYLEDKKIECRFMLFGVRVHDEEKRK